MFRAAHAARNYCFTYNNYPDNLDEFDERLRQYCTYAIYGRKVAPSTKTPHLQGYIQLKEKERLTGVAKKLPGCHLIVAKGGYDANLEYCSKEGLVFTYGEPSTAGKRIGLEDACNALKEGRTLCSIAEEKGYLNDRYRIVVLSRGVSIKGVLRGHRACERLRTSKTFRLTLRRHIAGIFAAVVLIECRVGQCVSAVTVAGDYSE